MRIVPSLPEPPFTVRHRISAESLSLDSLPMIKYLLATSGYFGILTGQATGQ
jgi:hypothetical protein